MGYDVVDKHYVLNESEAETVRYIYESYVDGFGYNRIINYLNEKAITTKKGKPFLKNSINSILRNEKYRGIYIHNRATSKDENGKRNNHASKSEDEIIRIEGGMPRIIEDDLWFKAQELLEGRKWNGRNKTTEKVIYLLSGIMKCSVCGANMVANRRRGGRNKTLYVTYICGNRNRGDKCNLKEINRDYIEDFLVTMLIKELLSDMKAKELTQAYNEKLKEAHQSGLSRVKEIEKQIVKQTEALDRYMDAIAEGTFSLTLKQRIRDAEETLKKLQEQYRAIKTQEKQAIISEKDVVKQFRKVKRIILEKTKSLDKTALKSFVQTFVKLIEVDNQVVTIHFTYDIETQRENHASVDVVNSGGDGGN